MSTPVRQAPTPPVTPRTLPASSPKSSVAIRRADQPVRRWYFVDWLRVLAVLCVLLYHGASLFDYQSVLLNSPRLDWQVTQYVRVVELWGMPLLFVVAGVAMSFSLAHRTSQRFVTERLTRLVIPLCIGIFVLSPPIVYIQRITHHEFAGSFWQFLPHYFDGWYGFGGNFAWNSLHLWFLLQLFLFSVLMLPLFRYLARAPRVAAALERFPALRGELFLIVLICGTALIEALVNLQPRGIGMRIVGGWSILSYLTFFVGGYLLALNPQALTSFARNWMRTLLVGICAVALYLVLAVGYQSSTDTVPMSALRAVIAWCWLATIIGVAKRYLDFGTALLSEANQAVLVFYILHLPVMVGVAYCTLTWDLPILATYLFTEVVSMVIIIGLYVALIRPFPVMRMAFGMKARKARVHGPRTLLPR